MTSHTTKGAITTKATTMMAIMIKVITIKDTVVSVDMEDMATKVAIVAEEAGASVEEEDQVVVVSTTPGAEGVAAEEKATKKVAVQVAMAKKVKKEVMDKEEMQKVAIVPWVVILHRWSKLRSEEEDSAEAVDFRQAVAGVAVGPIVLTSPTSLHRKAGHAKRMMAKEVVAMEVTVEKVRKDDCIETHPPIHVTYRALL